MAKQAQGKRLMELASVDKETRNAAVKNLEAIRSEFPALERTHNGYPVAYFDGPGGTQVPRSVVEAISDYLYNHNANSHWNYPTSQETDDLLDEAREVFAEFFNCKNDEIVFGANMTTLTYHAARALGINWGEGDEIIVTELDHHANVDPWKRLEKERGVKAKSVRFDTKSGKLDWDHLTGLMNSKTKLLAIGAASNALGTVNDIKKATELAHKHGALIYVDAVHHASHCLPDVKDLDCDFLVCSPYKFYGPHLGVLYGKNDLLQSTDFPKLAPAPDSAPNRAETGTMNHEGIVGAAAAVKFLASLAPGNSLREKLKASTHELERRADILLARLWNGLSELKKVQLYGPEPGEARTATMSFSIEGMDPAEICKALAKKGLFASNGDFYAQTVVKRLGLTDKGGLVRIGCACYNSEDEIDRLLESIGEIAGQPHISHE